MPKQSISSQNEINTGIHIARNTPQKFLSFRKVYNLRVALVFYYSLLLS